MTPQQRDELRKAKRDARNSLGELVEAVGDILQNRVEFLDESAEQAAGELLEALHEVFRRHRQQPEYKPRPHCPECKGDGVANFLRPFAPLRYSHGDTACIRKRWRCARCRCRFLDNEEHGLELEHFPDR